jgi:hypothetical protein
MRADPLSLTGAEVSGQAVIDGFVGNLFTSQLVPSTGYGNSGNPPKADNLPITDDMVEFGLAQPTPSILIEANFQTSGVVSLRYITNSIVPINYTFTSPAFSQASKKFKVIKNDFDYQGMGPEVRLAGDTLSFNVGELPLLIGTATLDYVIQLFVVGDAAWVSGFRLPFLQCHSTVLNAVVVHAGFVGVPATFRVNMSYTILFICIVADTYSLYSQKA